MSLGRIITTAILTAAAVVGVVRPAAGTIDPAQFSDVAAQAGITYVGQSWGSAWGDFDGDGDPDLWLVDHYEPPTLYRNLGDGTFADVTADLLPAAHLTGSYDTHGAAWADFDGDGDLDLLQLADGGTLGLYGSRLYVQNAAGTFDDLAAAHGLDFPSGRGRMPLWLDFDRDGRLDVLVPTARLVGTPDAPTALFRQGESGFTDVADAVGLVPNATGVTDFVQLADLTGDGRPELLPNVATFPDRVYEMSGAVFVNVRYDLVLASTYTVVDAAVADLDGDLDNDLYLVRGELTHGLVQVDDTTLEVHVRDTDGLERGVAFRASGDIVVDVWPRWNWSLSQIFIGSEGAHPASHTIALSPADTTTWGTPAHAAGDPGLFLGYDPDTGLWTVTRSRGLVNLVVTGDQPLTEPTRIGWNAGEDPPADRFLRADTGRFTDASEAVGLGFPSSGRSVVAGDFDNDRDLDLYVVATGPVENRPNILYENDGSGNFTAVPAAGGAAGGPDGRGDNVTAADYDGDGFLDLLVTNGVSKPPFDYDGPTHLFRNVGNANHWLQIDLVGTVSNRDGIGAQVIITSGGVSQLREQNGGVHCRGQNHQRLHFGLGGHTMVDSVRIRWPGGGDQVLTGVAADQILVVTEPGAAGIEAVPPGPRAVRLLRCAPNPFNPATSVVFELPRPQRVDLEVFDVTGRLVRRLIAGESRPAGLNRTTWDGRDGRGRPVGSGVYIAHLRAAGHRESRRMILVK